MPSIIDLCYEVIEPDKSLYYDFTDFYGLFFDSEISSAKFYYNYYTFYPDLIGFTSGSHLFYFLKGLSYRFLSFFKAGFGYLRSNLSLTDLSYLRIYLSSFYFWNKLSALFYNAWTLSLSTSILTSYSFGSKVRA